MNHKLSRVSGILILFLMLASQVNAQFKWGIQDFSFAVANAQYGVPFLQFTPIHPGIELEAGFGKKEGKRGSHSLSLNGGYFYHSVLANVVYAQGRYQYQINVKEVIGIDLGAGVGYSHMIYPGEAYSYNESVDQFESRSYHKGFFLASAGAGLSYIKAQTFQPFIRYDMMLLGNLYQQVSLLKLGLRIKL